MSKHYTIQARVKSGGDVVQITDFKFSAPAGEIYSTLSTSLAPFSPALDPTLPITFEIGITKGGSTHWAKLLDDGQLGDRNDAFRAKADQTSINVLSKLARKWKLTPRTPITLYDPAQVDISTEVAQTQSDVVDENGNPIEPLYMPIAGLDIVQLLNFIYVDKLGFGEVVTNIPNYPLQRASFGLTSPYHSVAASQIALFEPEYSSDGLARIIIIDPQGTLPTGFAETVRECPPGSYAEFQYSQKIAPETNAVLFTYAVNTSTSDVEPIEKVEQDAPQVVGTFGSDDYQRTIRTRFIKQWHDPNNPDRITRSITYKTETRVSAKADGLTREVSIETEEDRYQYDWRLKVGYTKTLKLYIKLPSELVAGMRTIQTETTQIIYGTTSDPNELVKKGQITDINGGIVFERDLFEGDLFDPALTDFKMSLYDANATGSISDDLQVRFNTPISSRIEQWREVGTDQVQVSYQEIDHLTGKPRRNGTIPHTGTIRVRIGQQDRRARQTMLLRNTESEEAEGTLPPVSVDAGDIPFDFAFERAQLILARHGQQPQKVNITFAGLDLALRRGSLRKVSDRAGQEYLTFITGYSIEGKGLGTRDFSITQQAEGIVLQTI